MKFHFNIRRQPVSINTVRAAAGGYPARHAAERRFDAVWVMCAIVRKIAASEPTRTHWEKGQSPFPTR